MNELWDRLMFAQGQSPSSPEDQQRIMQALALQQMAARKPAPTPPPAPLPSQGGPMIPPPPWIPPDWRA